MPSALQLIERLMIDKLFSAPAPLSGLEKTKQFLCLLSASFLAMGFVFLVYGAHTWLSAYYSDAFAAIITGLVSLALSVVIAIMHFAAIRYHKARIRTFRKTITDEIMSSISILENELGDPIRENPKTSLIIASVLGFWIEDQFSK